MRIECESDVHGPNLANGSSSLGDCEDVVFDEALVYSEFGLDHAPYLLELGD